MTPMRTQETETEAVEPEETTACIHDSTNDNSNSTHVTRNSNNINNTSNNNNNIINASSHNKNNGSNINNNTRQQSTNPVSNNSTMTTKAATTTRVPFKTSWLRNRLRTSAGRCLFLVACLGLSVLAAYLGSKIVLGGIFMQECPAEPFVPIYLVLSSSIFIIFIAILCIIFFKYRHRYEDEESISPIYLMSLAYSFIHLVLQLAGSVCVIRTSDMYNNSRRSDDNADVISDDKCDNTLLTYAFGVVIFELILSCVFFLLAMVILCQIIYVECCKSNSKATTNPRSESVSQSQPQAQSRI